MIVYQEQPERLVTRADLDRANNKDRRDGIGTLNSHAEYWREVADWTAANNRALLEQIETLKARVAELESRLEER